MNCLLLCLAALACLLLWRRSYETFDTSLDTGPFAAGCKLMYNKADKTAPVACLSKYSVEPPSGWWELHATTPDGVRLRDDATGFQLFRA